MSPLLRCSALLIALVSSAAMAAEWVKQPTWKVDGNQDAVIDEFLVSANGWLIQDASDRVGLSTDQGVTWTEIKAPANLPVIKLSGPALFAKSEDAIFPDSMCVYDLVQKRWIPSNSPPISGYSSDSRTGGWGDYYQSSHYQEDTAWFYQSKDSGRTWQELAKVTPRSLPSTILDLQDVYVSNDLISYKHPTRPLIYLSQNGIVWDSLIPPVFPNWKLEYGAFFHSESTFTAIYVDDSEQSMAKSTDDFGKNWSSMDMDAPGFSLATVPLLNGAFLSAAKPTDSTDLSDFHWYYGSSAKGPWVPLPDLQSINEIGNVVNGKLYASQPDGIYALTLPTVGLQARTSLASTLRASVQAGAIVVSGAQPGAWELLDAQGRRALAGTTREARFTIAAPGRGMWIVRVGQQRTVVMVP